MSKEKRMTGDEKEYAEACNLIQMAIGDKMDFDVQSFIEKIPLEENASLCTDCESFHTYLINIQVEKTDPRYSQSEDEILVCVGCYEKRLKALDRKGKSKLTKWMQSWVN